MKIELLGAAEFSKALKKLGSELPATLATGRNRDQGIDKCASRYQASTRTRTGI